MTIPRVKAANPRTVENLHTMFDSPELNYSQPFISE